jgi:hypothetical protein
VKTLDRTPEQTASEAAWIAGVRKSHFDRLVHWLSDSALCDSFGYLGGGWQEMTGVPTVEAEAARYIQAGFAQRLIVANDPTTTFVLASELLDMKLTPTFEPTKMQEILPDNLFHSKGTSVYLLFDVNRDTTPTCEWIPEQRGPLPRAELRAVGKKSAKPKSRAFTMFDELRGWLSLTTQETARLVGVGRTTPLAWEREGRDPRPGHARRLYQVHAIVGALVKRLGADATAEWLERGTPSPWERLERGEIESVARDAERILLQREPRSMLPDRDALVVEDEAASGQAPGVIPLRAGRRRRTRRGGDAA